MGNSTSTSSDSKSETKDTEKLNLKSLKKLFQSLSYEDSKTFAATTSAEVFNYLYQLIDKNTEETLIYVYAKNKKDLADKLLDLDITTDYILNRYVPQIRKNIEETEKALKNMRDFTADIKRRYGNSPEFDDPSLQEKDRENTLTIDEEVMCSLFGSEKTCNKIVNNLDKIASESGVSDDELKNLSIIDSILLLIKKSKSLRKYVIKFLLSTEKDDDFGLNVVEIKLNNICY
jgi:hypothetical protein